MKKIYFIISMLLFVCFADASPKMRIITSYPYIASLTMQITGNRAAVSALARGDWDPHVITPKPSFIAKARTADLIIANGAQLEIGWLPPILSQSNNPRIQPGRKGFLDLSASIRLKEVPSGVSRSGGDVHPDGNPHFYLDPDNIPILARVIASRLIELDPAGAGIYRSNLAAFLKKWNEKSNGWKTRLKGMRGKKVIVYHSNYKYLLDRIGVAQVATIEPLPGIPPTSKHMEWLLNKCRMENVSLILQDVYNASDSAGYLSRKCGKKLVILPHDVTAVSEARDIYTLFDEITRRLAQ